MDARILWFVAATGCWLLALHPFITYPLSLIVMGGRPALLRRSDAGTASSPSMGICTCAYNEIGLIEEKIRNLLALRQGYPGLQIFIYVDGADDGTAQIVERYADVITVDISLERHGKTYGMNRLVSRCTADILVFTDANVIVDEKALQALAVHFEDPAIGCVCGNLIYTNSNTSVTAATGSLYWRLEQFIKRRESRFGSVMGADGSLFAMRRSAHRSPPDHIIDDMYVSFQVLCAGLQIVQVDDVKAFEESVTAGSEEFRRKVRIACQAFNVHRLIWPDLRASFGWRLMYMYFSHKLLRWVSIYLLALGFLCVLAGLASLHLPLVALALTVSVALLLWIGGKWQIRYLSQIADILTALLGAGVGVWRSLRGQQYQTWQPAASIRK